MPYEGERIVNRRTGQRMHFLELSEDVLRIETVNPTADVPEPLHVHPKQESGAEVISGSLLFEVDGERRSIRPGETISIPPNTPHRFWNEGTVDAHSVQCFRPALDIAAFFETLFALAERGELDDKGMPRPLQLAVMVGEFSEEIRPVRPPWPLLRVLGAVLGPAARRRGYRARLKVAAPKR